MSYKRNKAPVDYDPDWLDKEHEHIEQVTYDQLKLKILNVAPAKPREGWVVLADGTHWNPGSGAGMYRYQGGAWNFVG